MEELEKEEMGREEMGLGVGLKKGFRALREVCMCETEGFERRFRRQNVEERAILYIQRVDEEYGARFTLVEAFISPRIGLFRPLAV